MSRRVEVSAAAKSDLRRIVAWYAKRMGAAAAKRVNATLRQGLHAVSAIDLNAAERPDLPHGYFRVVAREHVVVFVMRGEAAFVVRILHGARDTAEALTDDQDET